MFTRPAIRAGNRPARALSLRRMSRSFPHLLLGTAMVIVAAPAHADICKYQDPEGNVHYSNIAPEKGWKRLSCTISDDGTPQRAGPVNGTATRKTPTPAGFPRVDGETQKVRDDMRKKVLGDELATEQRLLADARVAYADGAPSPLPEEKTDTERYRARLGKLRQTVNVHEKNVEALKKELSLVK
jgi:hypothetical protein